MYCGRLSKKAKPKIDPQIAQMGADSRQHQPSLIDYLLGSICVNQRNLRIKEFSDISTIGNPPAIPGHLKSLTVPGVNESSPLCEPLKVLRKGGFRGATSKAYAIGYFVSTVGRGEEIIRNYIRSQEAEDSRLDQLKLLK
jgi:hypothetical protein